MGAWRITHKDLILLFRDRYALALLLIMPLIVISIVGFSSGQVTGWGDSPDQMKIAVVDQDGGDVARNVVERLRGHEGVDVLELSSRAGAEQLVWDGERSAAVVIGPEFQTRVDRLTPRDVINLEQGALASGIRDLDVHIETRPALDATATVVDMMVHGDVLRSVAPYVIEKSPVLRRFYQGPPSENREPASPSVADVPDSNQTLTAGAAPKRSEAVYQRIVPAYTVMFMFFLVAVMARSFLSERELGTLRRILTSPIGHGWLLLGKTIPFLLISFSQGLLLFAFGWLLFGMKWGATPELLLPVIASTALAATALGLLTATLVRTDAQVSAYAMLIVLTMAGISGCFMPREMLPEAMRQISLATPHAWALIAFDQLLAAPNPNLQKVWQCCLALAAFSVGFFLLGWWRFRPAT
jgi:ABC-2 type transport system permease protein